MTNSNIGLWLLSCGAILQLLSAAVIGCLYPTLVPIALALAGAAAHLAGLVWLARHGRSTIYVGDE